jgi:hypothetical protein
VSDGGGWLPVKPPEGPFFGVDRSIPVQICRTVPDSRTERARRWLGYKLYAVVYWLLRGHA